eukprot:2866171-Rhodomonas_salina.1
MSWSRILKHKWRTCKNCWRLHIVPSHVHHPPPDEVRGTGLVLSSLTGSNPSPHVFAAQGCNLHSSKAAHRSERVIVSERVTGASVSTGARLKK